MKSIEELKKEVSSVTLEELRQQLVNRQDLAEHCTNEEKLCLLILRELNKALTKKDGKQLFKAVLNCDYLLTKTKSINFKEMRVYHTSDMKSAFQLYLKTSDFSFDIVSSSNQSVFVERYRVYNDICSLNMNFNNCAFPCKHIAYQRVYAVMQTLHAIKNGTIDELIHAREEEAKKAEAKKAEAKKAEAKKAEAKKAE